jgi:DNA-binding GntR family transcriptional regulator
VTIAHHGDDGLAQRVYREMLRDIMAGELAPGSRLKERDLSDRYAASRIPVRQAIQRLEGEGFVMSEPRRGAVVRRVTLSDANDVFDARLCIEPFAARLAARRVAAGLEDPAHLAALLHDDGSGGTRLPMSLEFHAELVRLSGNRLLSDLIRPLFGRMEWIFQITARARHDEQIEEHVQLYATLVRGEGDLAAALTYAHIELGRAPVLEALEGLDGD